ncbi:MAG: GGDEF domain-containing phosphodiesterase [Rhodocyclaceae bacterium]
MVVAEAATAPPEGHGSVDDSEWSALLARYMDQYGIDTRARSALRALARLPGVEAARGEWAAEFVARLVAEARHEGEDARRLQVFVDLFFQFPARDFERAWMNDLSIGWNALCAADHDAGLPMRAAHCLAQKCLETLKRGRESFSRLDADIALALGASGLLLCAILADAERHWLRVRNSSAGLVPFSESGARNLREALCAVLDAGENGVTGLLVGQVDAGSTATMTMDEEGWSLVCARSLSRLRGVLRARDVLCRIGRARFAVVLPKLASQAQVILAANKVARAFDAPVFAAGQEFRLLARVGAAWAPDHGNAANELLRCSNLALHEALQSRRSVATFDSKLLERSVRDSQMEEDFLRALDCGGFELHFQPQVDLRTGVCTGAEALLRWRRENFGPVSPPEAIQVAERLGVMPQLTRWILHQSCRAVAEFAQAGVAAKIAVNLTASDVGDPELPLAVSNAMDLWRVEPRMLKFELTETAMLANEEVSARVMASLRELGVGTSIDDFGTGYSSVILLKKLPLDELKLDRCFVGGAAHSGQDREIVRSLILLAHGLGLEVVAEGVEDTATLELLREFGCDRAQGFLISRPVPAREFVAWLHKHEPGYESSRKEPASCT